MYCPISRDLDARPQCVPEDDEHVKYHHHKGTSTEEEFLRRKTSAAAYLRNIKRSDPYVNLVVFSSCRLRRLHKLHYLASISGSINTDR